MAAADPRPGAVAPPGLERWIAVRLPRYLLFGLLLPWLLVWLRHWAAQAGFAPAEAAQLLRWEYAAWGWTVFHLSICVALATGCWVVTVMKGPMRSADSYPPEGRSSPLKKGPDRPL